MENTDVNYKIIRGTVNDCERVIKFMKKHFYPHEPLHMSLGLLDGHTCAKPLSVFSLKEARSLLAVTSSPEGEDEEIIGVCLNGESTPDKKHPEDSNRCSKFLKFMDLLVKINDDANIWKNTGLNRALDLHLLVVDSERRRTGIAQALFDRTIKMAVAEGYPMLSITCTSKYSAGLAEKMGMKCLAEIRYDEYLDEKGVPMFKPPKPHESAKTLVKIL